MTINDIKDPKQRDRIYRILNAKIESVWKLGEPREMPTMKVSGDIPVISDIDENTAATAIQAIAEKYGIGKHDLYMFRRAQGMVIYYALGRGCPIRIDLAMHIDSHIKWQ